MIKRHDAFVPMILVAFVSLAGITKATEKTEKRFRFSNPRAENVIVVDNVFGSISVSGTGGNEVIVTMEKTIEARSETSREAAQEEVYVDIIEEDDYIELYVDGPFRDGHRRSRRFREWRSRHYEVHYNFELRIPRNTEIVLKTVNDGEIFVNDIEGDYEIHNVNGGIRMKTVGGSGEVYAVNGDVSVDFAKNPERDCRFGTLNGELRLYFLPRLAADFKLKTFNGEIFSDFEVEYQPYQQTTDVERNGRTVYKTDKSMCVRVGRGGPRILLDGFNGDMYILERK